MPVNHIHNPVYTNEFCCSCGPRNRSCDICKFSSRIPQVTVLDPTSYGSIVDIKQMQLQKDEELAKREEFQNRYGFKKGVEMDEISNFSHIINS